MGCGSAAEEPQFQGRVRALWCFGVDAFYCTETSTVNTRGWKKQSHMTGAFVMKSTVQVKSDAKVVVVMNSHNAEPSLH